MRNAEKFLAQGKIKAAIGEYQQIVDNDPKDYGTMNMLGDLYTKASEPRAAVSCYSAVADHYSRQGFAQKAIAVYNKISRIQPNSVAVSEKLAELYKTKGSVTEAKSHYVVLAENYQAKGRVVEALSMWKQIALLDPSNTEVYKTIAESYLRAGQAAEAVDAFANAGDRFMSRKMIAEAEAMYLRGLEQIPTELRCLKGYVDVQLETGKPSAAAEKLESVFAENKSNREVLFLLIDVYLKADKAAEAEKAVIKLVEQEPANYPKFLELADHYLDALDFDGASRMLTMASEHMLAGGQAQDFIRSVRRILEHQPENLDAVRLLVRFCTWQRDEQSLKDSLCRLAEVARDQDSVDDERFALSQLVMFMPQEASFADRLMELNAEHGFEDDAPVTHSMFDDRFFKRNEPAAAPADFAIVGAVVETSNGAPIESSEPPAEAVGEVETVVAATEVVDDSPEGRVRREAESIRFYIDNGYTELAEKAIEEFAAEFGDVPELHQLRSYLAGGESAPTVQPEIVSVEPVAAPATNGNKLFDLGEFRNELGLEETETADDADFETKYQTAIAYKEMGLLEQAIAEFQDAAGIVKPNDGTRRFFNCANLLGLSFMENGMPKLALKWYERALEINDLSADEKQALWYELGIVHEAEANFEQAERYFEQVYTENVDFRDVRERLKNMSVAA